MHTPGKLIVFEGPDGVGKSTLARAIADALAVRETPCELLAFPGREPDSLGHLVYQLHHDPKRFGLTAIPPASLQLLHIAAHLDEIASRILPALQAGRWVVLDRFWWSTWVYGLIGGAQRKTLDAMIAVERAEWAKVVPATVFLVCRPTPLRAEEPIGRWLELASAYRELAQREEAHYPVCRLDNEGTVAEGVRRAMEVVDGLRFRLLTPPRGLQRSGRPARRSGDTPPGQGNLFSFVEGNPQPATNQPISDESRRGPQLLCPMAPAKPSVVYRTYWRFAAERQAVFFRRMEGVTPVTADPILAKHKFCNAYRASDRVSQYLIRNVIYRHDQSAEEVAFRTLLFKLFNKIETWELLERKIGTPRYAGYSFEKYSATLDRALAAGQAIYSAAYIMPSGSGEFEEKRKHHSHLKLLERMMRDRLAPRLGECRTMRQAFELIRSYPMIGDFLAYQYVTDVNYGPVCDFDEMDFVIPGPGARDGIRKCFVSLGGLSEPDIIRWVADNQHRELERLGVSFRSLWGRPLQLIDCQNLFCEVDKYARLAHPDVQGISGRTRIKQVYRPNPVPIRFWYPPKWGINDRAEAAQRSGRAPEE
jgi:thymidylate kinase